MQAEALVVFFLNFSVCLFFLVFRIFSNLVLGRVLFVLTIGDEKKKMKMSTTANAVKDRTVTTGRSYYYHYLI